MEIGKSNILPVLPVLIGVLFSIVVQHEFKSCGPQGLDSSTVQICKTTFILNLRGKNMVLLKITWPQP